MCQMVFMCLVRKAVAPLEHNLVFIPEVIEEKMKNKSLFLENISHKFAFLKKT